MFRWPRRPPDRLTRRAAPSLLALEHRAMLSVNGADTRAAESIRPEAVGGAIYSPEAARVDQQVKFVDSLFKNYRIPG